MNGDGPLSWRDVFTAVGDSEKRLSGDIAELRTAVLAVTTDHETRIRVVEAAQLLSKGKRIGMFEAMGVGRSILLFIFAGAGPVLAVAALVIK